MSLGGPEEDSVWFGVGVFPRLGLPSMGMRRRRRRHARYRGSIRPLPCAALYHPRLKSAEPREEKHKNRPASLALCAHVTRLRGKGVRFGATIRFLSGDPS